MIPAFESGANHLPQGIHVATLDEVEDRFVVAAPYADRRKIIFDTFRVWHQVVSDILPNAKFWVNGGFVTHKDWAAPDDVDVVVLVKQEDLNALTPEQESRLDPMFTDTEPLRIQPMSGMIDAFICVRGDVDGTLYWRETWSTLTDESRNPIPNMRKGYLEVRP